MYTGIPNIWDKPFAGQDIMNVISLLITGQPYNFVTYYKSTLELNNSVTDAQSGQSPAHTYFSRLREQLDKRNVMWGNFIPFKYLSIDERQYAEYIGAQKRIIDKNKALQDLIPEIVDLKNKQYLLNGQPGYDPVVYSQQDIYLNEKLKSANQLQIELRNDPKSAPFNIVGDSIEFDEDTFLNDGQESKSKSDDNIRKKLRKKLNYLTRRMSWQVRANEDKNLFIVDDSYDKDYDIAAFEKSFTAGMTIFENDYCSITDNLTTAKNLLNLEVYADTQGHIRVRAPQYNRMPSSVFARMMQLKKTTGVQVFPEFLNSFLTDQLNTLKERVEVLEDQIRLDCAILGYKNDYDATLFLVSIDNYNSIFSFISSETTGDIIKIDQLISNAVNPDNAQDDQTLNALKTQNTSTKLLFDLTARFDRILEFTNPDKRSQFENISSIFEQDKVNAIKTRLERKTGQKILPDFYKVDKIVGTGSIIVGDGLDVDIIKVTNDIAGKLSERDRAIKLFYNGIKNASELKSLDAKDADKTSNAILLNASPQNANVPEIFASMIEDETFDDYGLDSGKRFVIKDSQIISFTSTETKPQYTTVQVNRKIRSISC